MPTLQGEFMRYLVLTILLCGLVSTICAAPVDTVDLLGGAGRFNETPTHDGWNFYSKKASSYQVSLQHYSDSVGWAIVIKCTTMDEPSKNAKARYKVMVPHGSRLMPRLKATTDRSRSLDFGFENYVGDDLFSWSAVIKESMTNVYVTKPFDFCSANHKTEEMYFYISGGHSIWEVAIPWVVVDMVPIECPGDSAYADSVARASQAEMLYSYLGYTPNAPKRMVLKKGISADVYFKNTSGDSVFGVTPAKPVYDSLSGDSLQIIDFSELKTPGRYTVWQGSSLLERGSRSVTIGAAPLDTLLMTSLAFFYVQRASSEIMGNGVFRQEAHLDNPVVLHASLGESGTIAASEGWYDGADYGKYVVNAGITVYTLLSLYEHYPEYLKELDWGLFYWRKIYDRVKLDWPQILNEVWYELRWLLRMRSKSGGVYHKVTSLEDPAYNVLPEQDTLPRFVIGKSAAASYDFAAIMATASRVYREYDEAFADTCLNAAKVAFEWAEEHQDALFKDNPFGVSTKPYADSIILDERQFAMTELAITTKDKKYIVDGASSDIPNWQNVYGLATYGKATHAELFGNIASVAKSFIVKKADSLVERTKSGIGVTLAESDFVNGSNGIAANQAIWLLHAYYVTGEEKYVDAAWTVLYYFFGCNPTQKMYITYKNIIVGNSVMPYHRISSEASDSRDAVHGMLLNGPEKVENAEELGFSPYVARSIRGGNQRTAEVSIDKNAALAYLLGSMVALEKGLKPEFMEASMKLPLVDIQDSSDVQDSTSEELPKQDSSDVQDSTSEELPKQDSSDVQDSTSEEHPKKDSSDVQDSTSEEHPKKDSSDVQDSTSAKHPKKDSSNVQDSTSEKHQLLLTEKSIRKADDTRRIWFDGHSLYVKKAGLRYDLKGNRIDF